MPLIFPSIRMQPKRRLWTPARLTSEHYEFVALDAVGYPQTAITSWPSRNSTSAVVATIPQDYAYGANASYPGSLYFYGNNRYDVTALSAVPSQRTMWALVNPATPNNNSTDTIFGGSATGSLQWRINFNKQQLVSQFVANIATGTSAIAYGSPAILMATYDGINKQFAFRVNGVLDASGALTVLPSAGTLVLDFNGCYGASGIMGEGMTGNMYDQGYAEGIMSTSDMQRIEGYLAWYNGNGFQSLLQASHPYKNSPPTY